MEISQQLLSGMAPTQDVSVSSQMLRSDQVTPLSELREEQTDRIGKMRDIKSQINNLMAKLDHESKTLLSSFSQL